MSVINPAATATVVSRRFVRGEDMRGLLVGQVCTVRYPA
jgi:hypothetical protein